MMRKRSEPGEPWPSEGSGRSPSGSDLFRVSFGSIRKRHSKKKKDGWLEVGLRRRCAGVCDADQASDRAGCGGREERRCVGLSRVIWDARDAGDVQRTIGVDGKGKQAQDDPRAESWCEAVPVPFASNFRRMDGAFFSQLHNSFVWCDSHSPFHFHWQVLEVFQKSNNGS